VRRGFDACRESNAYLFSWTNTATDEDEDGEPRVFQKLENAIEVGQFHPSPTCIGVIYRKGMRTVYQPNEQVSYAMGMEHFAKDGRIIRLASVRDNFDYELSVSTQSYPKLRDEDLPPFLSKVEPPKRQRSSKNKILAVAGVPASGKTTIMREFLKRTGNWQKRKLKQSLDALYNRKLDCFILGSYEENETFAGTDRLSMSIQPQTVEFVKETKSKVIYEGDRLFNASFLEVCRAEKIGFKIFEISATDATLKQRHKLRKDKQSKTFLESRATKVRNVCRSPSFFRDVVGFENENDTDMEEIISEMVDFCGKK